MLKRMLLLRIFSRGNDERNRWHQTNQEYQKSNGIELTNNLYTVTQLEEFDTTSAGSKTYGSNLKQQMAWSLKKSLCRMK